MGNQAVKQKQTYVCGGVPHNFNPQFKHARQEELAFISGADSGALTGDDECYLISEEWLNRWVEYAQGGEVNVGPIDNRQLVEEDNSLQNLSLVEETEISATDNNDKEIDMQKLIESKAQEEFEDDEDDEGDEEIEISEIDVKPQFTKRKSITPSIPIPTTDNIPGRRSSWFGSDISGNATVSVNTPIQGGRRGSWFSSALPESTLDNNNESVLSALDTTNNKKWKLKSNIVIKKDFRPVNKSVWSYYFMAYGGGPVIALRVPIGCTEKEYKTGKWINQIDLASVTSVVIPGEEEVILHMAKAINLNESVEIGVIESMRYAQGVSLIQEGVAVKNEMSQLMFHSIGSIFEDNFIKNRKNESAAPATEEETKNMSASLIQRVWKNLKSKQKYESLREKKRMLLQRGAVIVVQSAWRKRRARKTVSVRQMEREKEMKEKREKQLAQLAVIKRMETSSVIIQSRIRAMLASRRLLEITKMAHPHVVMVQIRKAKGINVGDSTVSDPYVVVSAYHLMSRDVPWKFSMTLDSGLKSSPNKRRKSVVSGPNMDKMTLVSQYRTNKVFATTDPVWDECMYMCCNHNSQIVLTLFDHNTMGRHQFLGQHIIDLKDCQDLYGRSESKSFKENVGSYLIGVQDCVTQQPLVPSGEATLKGKGKIHYTLRACPLYRSMCGWVLRASTAFMTRGQFKRRWMILADSSLMCFESPFTMENSKGILKFNDISAVEELNTQDGLALKISCGSSEPWTIRWDEEEHKSTQQMWQRKFVNSLPRRIRVIKVPTAGGYLSSNAKHKSPSKK